VPDEQRARLEQRLKEVTADLLISPGSSPDTTAGKRTAQLIETRNQIELALAQLDVAAAQRETSAAQRELAEAENRSAKALEDDRAGRDDATFWSRRFYTSLAVGNGVGFVTISTALIQSGKVGLAVVIGFGPLMYFALGLAAAGTIPWFIWRQRALKPSNWWQQILSPLPLFVSTVSSGFFLMGLGSAVFEVWQLNPVAAKIAESEAKVAGQQAGLILRTPPSSAPSQ
jgi:hypothetical protein